MRRNRDEWTSCQPIHSYCSVLCIICIVRTYKGDPLLPTTSVKPSHYVLQEDLWGSWSSTEWITQESAILNCGGALAFAIVPWIRPNSFICVTHGSWSSANQVDSHKKEWIGRITILHATTSGFRASFSSHGQLHRTRICTSYKKYCGTTPQP